MNLLEVPQPNQKPLSQNDIEAAGNKLKESGSKFVYKAKDEAAQPLVKEPQVEAKKPAVAASGGPAKISKFSYFAKSPIEVEDYMRVSGELKGVDATNKPAQEPKHYFMQSSNHTMDITEITQEVWKPPRLHSYEVMGLADS